MSPAEKNYCFGFDMAKSVNFKLSGDEFFYDVNLKNNSAIVIPQFSTFLVKFAIVFVIYVKHLPLVLPHENIS